MLLKLAGILVWNYVCEMYIGSGGRGDEREQLQRRNKMENRFLIPGQFEVADLS
jgi:hypothetical protein